MSEAAVVDVPELAMARGSLTVDDRISEREWSAYVEQHPAATVDHQWGWRQVFGNVFGQESVYLAARRDGEVVGVLPLVKFRSRIFGRSVVSLPYLNYGGVLASDGDAAAVLIGEAASIARAFGASHVELRHRERQARGLTVRDHKVGMTLPLPATSDALWTTVDRKIRNQVRKAQKEGLGAESGGRELVDDFYGVFTRNMRDLGTPVYPRRLFEATLDAFPARARVHIVRYQGLAVAGSVTVGFRDTVLVPWASAHRDYRHVCPNMLLYWSMLEHSISTGARTFDFGRSSRDGGTHRFKAQWGAQEVPLHWEYALLGGKTVPDQGTSNPKMRFAIAAWQKMPLWLANTLGPRVVANIP